MQEELMARGYVPQFQLQNAVDTTDSYEQLNALIDESCTAGDTGILGSLVPRLLVPTTLADETAYTLT
jgi:hypothetical protein